MTLSFRDSLTGKVQPFRASKERAVAMYVCGPTVYDGAHVGHARTYLYFDVLRRYFQAIGQPVRHVMNITDFEDKITERAVSQGMHWAALARREERRFFADMAGFNILPPHIIPRSSEFVPAMIRLIRRLERTGRTYERGDSMFYRPPPESAGANFLIGAELRRHAVLEPGHAPPDVDATARDILLWRRQVPPAPSWESPWGRGAPGWHLECYAMASRHLGVPVDLHGGGLDLVFPHHYAENEIAREVSQTWFSHRFLHTAFVTEQ
ncbi:MAG TPA: class I tRNA ligase family protein, partial [Thermoplasmata archaeon]|nr:class I tRNA ligase family protein [Thermoplasmata archaeon]